MRTIRRFLRISMTVALFNIRSNLGRSAIICFSIFLGVSSVLIMISILRGMNRNLAREIEDIGGLKLIHVDPIKARNKLEEVMFARSPGLTAHQMEKAVREIPEIDFAIPRIFLINWEIRYGQKFARMHCGAFGHHYFDVYMGKFMIEGRSYNAEDEKYARCVCVIGQNIRDYFFRDGKWQGKKLAVMGIPMEVIGVAGDRYSRAIHFPMEVYWKYFKPKSEPFYKCEFVAKSVKDVYAARDKLAKLFQDEHRGVTDVEVTAVMDIRKELLQQQLAGKLVVIAMGIIALIIGAIGIVNILFAVLHENIRDIGILKTVGASNTEIFVQFLFESCLLAGIGAWAGFFGGSVLTFLPKGTFPWPAVLLWQDYLVAVGAAMAVGILSGLMPALTAARITPARAVGYQD